MQLAPQLQTKRPMLCVSSSKPAYSMNVSLPCVSPADMTIFFFFFPTRPAPFGLKGEATAVLAPGRRLACFQSHQTGFGSPQTGFKRRAWRGTAPSGRPGTD